MAVMATKFMLGSLALLLGMTHVIGSQVYNPGELLRKIPLVCPLPFKENSSIYEVKEVAVMLEAFFRMLPDYYERHKFQEALLYRSCSTGVHAAEFLALECQNVTPGRFCLYTSNESYPCVLKSLVSGTWSHDCFPGFYCEGGSSPMRACMKGAKCDWNSKAPEPCPEGKFCIMPGKPISCNPDDYPYDQFFQSNSLGGSVNHMLKGTLCMPDHHNLTVLPKACPRGSYCQKGRQYLCPAGNYCSAGSMDPKLCDFGWDVSCPAGADFPRRSANALVDVIVRLIVLAFLVSTMQWWMFQHRVKSLILRTVLVAIVFAWFWSRGMVEVSILYAFYAATLWGILVTPLLRNPSMMFQHRVKSLILRIVLVAIVFAWCWSRGMAEVSILYAFYAATLLGILVTHLLRNPSILLRVDARWGPFLARFWPQIVDTIFLVPLCALAKLGSQFLMILWMIGTLSYQVIVNPRVVPKTKPYMICFGIVVEATSIACCLVPGPIVGTNFQRALASNVSICLVMLLGFVLFPYCYERGGNNPNTQVMDWHLVEDGPQPPGVPAPGLVLAERDEVPEPDDATGVADPVVHPPEDCSVSIEVNDVSLTVEGKEILNEVSLQVPSGNSLAIMGVSGCGKTSLMNVMSGRAGYGTLRGNITINGDAGVSAEYIRSRTGFVPQDDMMHKSLTVEDNIQFQAWLRAGNGEDNSNAWFDWTVRELFVKRITDKMLQDLNLEGVRESKISTISGGQRKRVSIAMELMGNPSLLMLDEPTSGLDSATSATVVSLFAGAGRSIRCTSVAVIHLPAYETLNKFDKVAFLANKESEAGRLVYFGSTDGISEDSELRSFFDGADFDGVRNPADAIMTAITADPQGWADKWHLSHPQTEPIRRRRLPEVPSSSTWGQELFVHAVRAGKLLQNDMVPIRCPISCSGDWGSIIRNSLISGPLFVVNVLIQSPIIRNSLISGLLFVVIVQALDTRSDPIMEVVLQPSMELFALMITQTVSAQRIFGGTERFTSIREASVGLDMICYFIGRDLIAFIEIGLGTIIFTGVYWSFGPLLITEYQMFWTTFCFLYAVWGFAYIWSILLEPTQAMMVSIILTFACWLTSGMPIPFSKIVQIPFAPYIMAFSPIRWAHGYLMFKHTYQSNQFRCPLILLSVNATLNNYGIPVDAITNSSWQEDYPYIVDRWQKGNICFATGITQLIMLGLLYRVLAGMALLHRTQREASGGALFSDAKGSSWCLPFLLVQPRLS